LKRFEEAVLEVLRSLRSGEVVTYGEVAEQAGFPGAARAVGARTETPRLTVAVSGATLAVPDPVTVIPFDSLMVGG
jgi:hypothetical protein